ncbi:MAG: glucosamine--fructose-6-phosphate aminotransferase [Anaerolineales bacterium]|nr:SIS domain-containing protein [Anaerolineae bacterium]PWB68621.1 MAG: glucosamine--fructose-6-phosphate aminotransferase [Anaerolineales bacterium]
MTLHSEIFEQPEKLSALLDEQKQTVTGIAKAIQSRNVQYAFLAARGTSDNAGRYANYLWGAHNQLPLALATPSLFTYYQSPPRLQNALVVGVSQSGQSPDIVSVLEEGRKQNCLTLAITNVPDSPLAKTADFVLDIQAGPEKAVAATKTYTTELMAIAMLSAAMSNSDEQWRQLASVPEWARYVLKLDERIAQMTQRYRYMNQCVVLGRGFNYATAFEWALKLKELTYIIAEPYSSADFQHGPIAMVEGGFPVLAVAPNGKVHGSMTEMLTRLRKQHHAELVLISDDADALALAQSPIQLPPQIPEWLTPLVGIIPAQLFACHLTTVKGYDTEKPRSITKVTETH